MARTTVGMFRSPAHAEAYHEVYDRFVATTWPVPHDELDVPTRFGSTHVRRSGPADGTPLVLVHPTSGSSLGWHRLVEPLSRDHPVYTPDTIGTVGRSVQTAPVRSATDLATWLDDTLDALGLDRVHVVGYSEGGWIAGVHAGLTGAADRLATVTLVEPAGAIVRVPRRVLVSFVTRGMRVLAARDKPRALRDFNRWLSGDVELTDDEVELVLMAFRSFRARLPTPDRLDDDQLRSIGVPVLLLLGGDTRLFDPQRVAARATDLLPDVAVETTPGATHGLPFEHPGATAARILDFVADRGGNATVR